MRRFCLVAILVLGCSGSAGRVEPSATPDSSERVHRLLTSFRERYRFPGVTVAYAWPGRAIGEAAVGLADVEAEAPMTPESRMLAASVGKTIWGALVLLLEAEGIVDRDDPVSDHLGRLPWFSRVPNARDMTIGHLLTHSAGLPDHVHMESFQESLVRLGPSHRAEPRDAIAFILDAPPLFEAGTAWSYSDTGYLLLGLVIEAASGRNVF